MDKRLKIILIILSVSTLLFFLLTVYMFVQNYGVRNPITRSLIYRKVQVVTKVQKPKPQASTKPQTRLPGESVANAAVHTDSFYKLYIYTHESNDNPKEYNGSGCVGLGQACPASKLLAVCPTLDYNCEDQWFSDYAVQRYGSWEKAYNFWVENKWW